MGEGPVRRADAAGVATITLDSPDNRNALSSRLVGSLSEHLAAADADGDVRAIVLAAAGPVFCSGADLTEATTVGMDEAARSVIALQRQIVAAGKPVVVRLHSAVRAGGLGLVGAADIVIAAESVTFAFTEVRLGLAPTVISLTAIPRMTSRAAALTFLTAEEFDATTAREMGLVTQVVPDADLDEALAATTARLCKGLPQGLRETKRLVNRAIIEGLDAHGAEMAELSAGLFASEEAREAMLAFLDRSR